MAGQPTTCTENNSPSLLALLPLANCFPPPFFFKSLCVPQPFSLPLSGPICLSSSFISSSSATLSHFPFFPFFLLLSVPFLPSYSCSHSSSSILSFLSAPKAMWSRRGSRVTEAGPFGVASFLSHLRGDAVHVFECLCVSVPCVVCESRALFSRAKRGVRG